MLNQIKYVALWLLGGSLLVREYCPVISHSIALFVALTYNGKKIYKLMAFFARASKLRFTIITCCSYSLNQSILCISWQRYETFTLVNDVETVRCTLSPTRQRILTKHSNSWKPQKTPTSDTSLLTEFSIKTGILWSNWPKHTLVLFLASVSILGNCFCFWVFSIELLLKCFGH